jgi:hypothetical protein
VDGVVADLLAEAEAAGLRIAVDGETLRIRGPKGGASIAQQLAARKPAVLALLTDTWEAAIRDRMAAFRPQVPETGPIPFLTMTPSLAPQACLSCGESLTAGERHRCELCAEAVRRVLAEVEAERRRMRGAM